MDCDYGRKQYGERDSLLAIHLPRLYPLQWTAMKRAAIAAMRSQRSSEPARGDGQMFRRMLAFVRKIPHGKVATYGQIAYAAGFPGAARQVSWALHGSSGVPWHRVLGAGGHILLRGEAGFEQRMRLRAEGVAFAGQRVLIRDHQHGFLSPKSSARKRKQVRK